MMIIVPMEVILVGIVIVVSAKQFWKAASPDRAVKNDDVNDDINNNDDDNDDDNGDDDDDDDENDDDSTDGGNTSRYSNRW